MKSVKSILGILLGNLILALGVQGFVSPQGMIVGGATGIGLALNRFFGIELSYALWILNGILFILGWYVMGRKFAMTIVLSTIIYPLYINILDRFPALSSLTEDKLLSAFFGGALMGLGIGIVIRQGASTGGMDIPPLILNKKFGIPVGASMYAFDVVILLVQAFFSDSEQILYGILCVLLTSAVVNYVQVIGQRKVQMFIISEKYEEIRREILNDMDLGATLVNIETGYLGKEQKAVMCIASARKLYSANQAVLKIDPRAFISISHVSEVKGRGFTLDRNYH